MNWERLLVWTVGTLLVAASLGVGVVGTPYAATPDELQTVEKNPAVTVSSLGDGYVLSPGAGAVERDGDTPTALVFYPGGRVHPNAYVPVLAPVVERTGVTIFIPKPPLYLAVFDVDMAGQIITDHPEIEQWFVGGHSLGGAMACRYVARSPGQVSGLVLFGSYCDRDVGAADVRVLSVRGERDGILDAESARNNRENLPADGTIEVTIEGMNHSQFGGYGGQAGDARATIPDEGAHEALQDALVEFLRSNDGEAVAGFAFGPLGRADGEGNER
ncbi:alpha/beta hydrolase [Halanaeroarchaeum sp. HSR-CO]|uniref:alpha/beta hydrolase n=1 Tax=Halanaeroarchaeum sp. HSR-CO TaxID=2866382 RepID=UPI00217D3676|nr:alpha/beta hydrolase [Halanaeroarchaeum sp. HSR-CO]